MTESSTEQQEEQIAANGDQNPNDPHASNTHPDDIVEPENALPEAVLSDLSSTIQSAVANAGWTSLTPVQAKAIPYMLAGRDLMVQSRTGSGKTGAFVLPILEQINLKQDKTQALILVPTRELANQVAKATAELTQGSGVRSVAVYGGVGYGPQNRALKEGAHIVIGTPGRILDHLLRRTFTLNDLRFLVFDEADRMLSMGFYPDMREIQRYLPERRIHGYMFSATFPAEVLRLARVFLREPEFLSLSRDRVHVSNAEHVQYTTPTLKRDRSLVRLIEIENPTSAIIFCNTKTTVRYVTVVLQRFGYDADELSSDLNQQQREQVLGRVRDGKLRFLVATDVAARGIDIPELSHVFQYEPPDDPESYIHRAGRTARAGASGTCITLVETFAERMALDRIAKRYKIEMEERDLPTDEDVAAVVSERVTTLLEAKLRLRDSLKSERMQRFVPTVAEWSQDEEGRVLLAMLLDDFYQQSLHVPPVPPEQQAQEKPRQQEDRSRESDGKTDGKRRRRSGKRRRGKKRDS